jgi:hypothetical protein
MHPVRRLVRSGLGIECVTSRQNRVVLARMWLRRDQVADTAVAMPDVVPLHESRRPGAVRLQIIEAPHQELWSLLGRAEQRFGLGVVIADPRRRVGRFDP